MSDNDNETVGDRVGRLRRAAQIGQEELAEDVGVHPVTISKWENNVQRVSTRYLPELAKALSVPVEELIGADDPGRGWRAVAFYLRRIADELELSDPTSGDESEALRDHMDRQEGPGTGTEGGK